MPLLQNAPPQSFLLGVLGVLSLCVLALSLICAAAATPIDHWTTARKSVVQAPDSAWGDGTTTAVAPSQNPRRAAPPRVNAKPPRGRRERGDQKSLRSRALLICRCCRTRRPKAFCLAFSASSPSASWR